MDALGWIIVLGFVVYLLASWWVYQRQDSKAAPRVDESLDFSIYLYSSRRGQAPRQDEI
ncbi:hypothetical protein [Chitinibacter sp. GC72]|uniref:hypothetical protein n=1 Tax=Chitinibacter sp. GC72 TaxID=1526917 RepID=UPI0012FBA99F|nr:hypothetical protein [Chitinibacter sp. GC72]